MRNHFLVTYEVNGKRRTELESVDARQDLKSLSIFNDKRVTKIIRVSTYKKGIAEIEKQSVEDYEKGVYLEWNELMSAKV